MYEINSFSAPFAIFIFITTIICSLICFKNRRLMQKFILFPYQVVHNGKLYQLLTSGFIHSDFFHLLFNMLTFYFFAFDLEQTIGTKNFALIYLGSLILADLPTVMKHKNNYNYGSLGASGAISGVIFSSILLFPNNKMMIMPIPIPLPSFVFGIAYLIWCKMAASRKFGNADLMNRNINHDAHFAGAISGIILSLLLFGNEIIFIWRNFVTYLFD